MPRFQKRAALIFSAMLVVSSTAAKAEVPTALSDKELDRVTASGVGIGTAIVFIGVAATGFTIYRFFQQIDRIGSNAENYFVRDGGEVGGVNYDLFRDGADAALTGGEISGTISDPFGLLRQLFPVGTPVRAPNTDQSTDNAQPNAVDTPPREIHLWRVGES